MHKYDDQMRLILENMFDRKDKVSKKNSDNWICKMTNIVGGTLYQHPHSDQAWPLEHEKKPSLLWSPMVLVCIRLKCGCCRKVTEGKVNMAFCINSLQQQCSSWEEILSMQEALCDTLGVTWSFTRILEQVWWRSAVTTTGCFQILRPTSPRILPPRTKNMCSFGNTTPSLLHFRKANVLTTRKMVVSMNWLPTRRNLRTRWYMSLPYRQHSASSQIVVRVC